MSNLVLYDLEASPPASAVRILADMLGVTLKLEVQDLKVLEHKPPEYLKLNPMGTIPVLKDGDFVISDSNAIMKYLLGQYGGESSKKLYPSDLRSQVIVDQCLFFNAGVFFIKMRVVTLPTFFQGLEGPSQKQLDDIETAYGVVESYLQDRKYIATDYLTLADLAVGTTATFMQPIHKLDGKRFPRTAEWLARLDKEPSYKKFSDPGVAKLDAALKAHWKINKIKSQQN